MPGRVAALNDVIANLAGMLLGVLAARLARRFAPSMARHPAGQAASAALPRTLVPAVLMLLWLAYQWFPLVPTLDLQNMINAVKPLLRAPQVDMVRALHTGVAWLAFFALWGLATPRRMPALALAAAALCIVGAKLLIAGARISPSNIIGLGLAIACLPWRHHRAALPALIIAMFASLFATGLTPFAPLGQAQPFHWIPFYGMLEGSMGLNLMSLIEKCFFYGALIVLTSARSGRPLAAAIAVALCLAVIEAAQMFLPQRTAESTDPILALILGFVIALGAPRGRRARAAGPSR